MPILEECRDSDKIKVTYQTWTPGGIEFVFPTDATEDKEPSAKGWTEAFIEGARSVRYERDTTRGTYFTWGTATSKTEFGDNSYGKILFDCGDPIVWVNWFEVRSHSAYQGDYDTYNETDGQYYPAAFLVRPYYARIVKASEFNAEDFKITNKHDYIPGALVKMSDSPISIYHQLKHGTDCAFASVRGTRPFYVSSFSPPLGLVTVEEYWKTIVTFDNGSERRITSRTTKPLSAKIIESEANPEVQVELTKDSRYFDFELYDVGLAVRFLRVNRFTGKEFQDLSIVSGGWGRNPTYSYSCAIEECPEGTWTLECGDTTCCYNDQGYSIHQFPTP